MTEQFDPYRKWLGIPERDQPPHHYRLLGVEPFETDQEVIANAADARMAQIKTFQTGKHSDHSQRLLNELAAAKVCLLNPAKKAEYDRRLEEIVEGREERGEGREEGSVDADDVFPQVVVSSKPSAYLPRTRKTKPPIWFVPAIAAGVVVLLAVVFFSIQQSGDRQGPKGKDKNIAGKKPSPVVKERPSPPNESKPVARPEKPVKPVVESEPIEEPEPIEQPAAPPVVNEPEPVEPEPEQPKAEPKKPAPTRPPKKAGKPAVPDAAAQRAAETEIRKLYEKDFAEAVDAKRKAALARKLRRQAERTRNEPAARFVLGRLSAELSAEAGDLAKGFETLDRLADLYDADPLRMKIELASDAAPGYRIGVKTYDDFALLWINTDTLLRLADEAVRRDDFTSATQLARLAVQLARATKNTDFLRETATELREIEQLKPRFRPIEAALAVLAENPDDGEANLTVGRWRCLTVGDWQRGLPLLAKGSGASLAELAREELSRPKTGGERLALADAWFDAAARETSPAKADMMGRAAYWYALAEPALIGMDQTRAGKRIDELHAKGGIHGETERGSVVKGNVALAKRGARADGPSAPEKMLDGDTTTKEKDCNAYGKCPCQWTVTLNQVYFLREIRIKLKDFDKKRAYRYILSVSADGKHYTTVRDASKGDWSGWQQISFPSQPVKTIMIEGLYCNINAYFSVIELEAYCIPPLKYERGRGLH